MTGVRGHTLPTGTPMATSAYSTTTNRIAAGTYDGAGNLLSLAGVGTLSYDGENRLTAYDNNVVSLQEQATYAYDGLGQRVKRMTTIRGTSETTVYVYDAFGQLAAEYSSVAPVVGAGETFYRTEDHLGSTRLVTKQDQTVAECRDFFPFGERIGSGLNGRSDPCYGGTGDALTQQFTGKERDKESSLDYFGARYYSARLGRFTGVDPANAGAEPLVPQSWNGYAYAINNPLAFIDPNGLSWIRSGGGSVTWTDACAEGTNDCFDTLAVVDEGGITVYGSKSESDITPYAAKTVVVDDKQIMLINARTLSDHIDSAFEVKENNLGEDFLSPTRAVTLFNATSEYRDKYPDDLRIVMTGGSTAAGVSAKGLDRQSHKGGRNIDILYMNPKGNPIRGELASGSADSERMNILFKAFSKHGLGTALTGTPGNFDKRYAPRHKLEEKHMNHVHFQISIP